jgi:hypothetical protein
MDAIEASDDPQVGRSADVANRATFAAFLDAGGHCCDLFRKSRAVPASGNGGGTGDVSPM